MSTGRFKLVQVYLDELPFDRQQPADKEVRGLLSRLEFHRDVVQSVELTVLLVEELGPHVDRISEEYGRGESPPYDPFRLTVVAAGMTLTDLERPPLRASVILNQELWTRDDGESMTLRVYLLLHEIGHVIQEARRETSVHEVGEAPTHADQVRRDARILWGEADADLMADRICRAIFRTEEGEPIGPGNFLVDRFAGSAAVCLQHMCAFVEEEIAAYRMSHGPLDLLYPTAFTLVRELLRVLAHAAALCLGMKTVRSLTHAMQGVRGFHEFLADDWEAFLGALGESSAGVAEPELFRVWNAVLERLGLVIEDMPDGNRYVHVLEPRFCCREQVDSAGAAGE